MKSILPINKIALCVTSIFTIFHCVLFLTTSQLNDSGTLGLFLLVVATCYILPILYFLYATKNENKKTTKKIALTTQFIFCLVAYLFVTIWHFANISYDNGNFSNTMLGIPAIFIYVVLFCLNTLSVVFYFSDQAKPKTALEWAIKILAYVILAVFVGMIVHAICATFRVLGQTGMYRELVVLLEVLGYIVALVVLLAVWVVCKILLRKKLQHN